MERTVPSTASDEIDLYLRTLYSLLRSTVKIQLRSLEEVHAGMNSLLHPHARQQAPDMSAFIYSLLRLPPSMIQARSILLGQSFQVFNQHGFGDVETWQPAPARARRRRCFFDGDKTLAFFIASRSDIEDVVPCLVAYQIEWNKIHSLLQRLPPSFEWQTVERSTRSLVNLAEQLLIAPEDLDRLRVIWGDEFIPNLQCIAAEPCSIALRLLSGSLSDYRRATHAWWENIENQVPELAKRPVYFISSNTHSVTNLLAGFTRQIRADLVRFLEGSDDSELKAEWQDIRDRNVPSNEENFFYYMLKKYQQSPAGKDALRLQQVAEAACGIQRIPSEHYFDVEAQVIHLNQLKPKWIDPRVQNGDLSFLSHSDALILNIDYPLGLAAYNILSKISEHVHPILGVYILGKAAALNSSIGDIMIPNVVHDEQSRNTYLFPNAFIGADVAPYLIYGTGLDNQKAVTVAGTFLQNADFMDVFYREGYTDIEMEGGPYLSAVYEMYRPKRHPYDEIVNLYGIPFDLGVIHYTSDTPLSKGRNLGAGALSYFGMDSTYASSVAVLRRIIQLESKRAAQA